MDRMYFSALILPEPISEAIQNFKLNIRKHFGCGKALNARPHITICPPQFLDLNTYQTFSALTSEIAEQWPAGMVKLNGMGRFGRRVIFINTEVSKTFLAAFRFAADTLAGSALMDVRHRTWRPHITLATRDIPAGRFDDLMAFCQNLPLVQETVLVSTLALFMHDGKKWHVCDQFPLAGLRDSSAT